MNVIVTTTEELKVLLKETLEEMEEKRSKKEPPKVYTRNQVAKMLGMSNATVQKKIDSGLIKTTKDGRIPEDSINDYLKGK